MKMKIKVAVVLMLMLAIASASTAFATGLDNSAVPPRTYDYDDSAYLPMIYVDAGDLGDENVPMALLYGGVVLVAISAIIVHQKRKRVQ